MTELLPSPRAWEKPSVSRSSCKGSGVAAIGVKFYSSSFLIALGLTPTAASEMKSETRAPRHSAATTHQNMFHLNTSRKDQLSMPDL